LDESSARRKAVIYTQDNTNTEETRTETYIPTTISALERAKTVHASDRAVIVIGLCYNDA
jgi:hypothetical protein